MLTKRKNKFKNSLKRSTQTFIKVKVSETAKKM